MPGIRSMPLVLVVDDDEACARVLARGLRKRGIDVRVAANGREARVVVDQESDALDGALLDVALPDSSGTEIAEHLRAKNSRARIALVSGEVDEQKVRAKMIGLSVPLFAKPFADEDLGNWAAGVITESPKTKFEAALERVRNECRLTPKEVDVVRAAREGSSEHKALAARLDIGLETVRTHVKSIRRKTRRSLRELLDRFQKGG